MRRRAALLIGAALAVLPASAAAQAPPLQISADNMIGSHGPEGDIVDLTGNVRIVRGRTVVTARRGRYLRAQRMVFLEQRVRLVDSTTTITCDRATYSEDRDLLELSGDVTLEDGDATLHAPAATYDRRLGRADLYGGVTGSDADREVTADRAYYLRDSLQLKARGNVVGTDDRHRLVLRAQSVDWDRDDHEAVATGDPVLEVEDERGRRSRIHARVLKVNTETRLAEALDSVLVVRDSLRARGDYGLFDDRAQRGWLLGQPRAWDDETVVTGDTLELLTEKRELDRVIVRGNAAADYRGLGAGKAGETSRLTGRQIDVHFGDEEIDSVIAVGGAANEYQGVPERGRTAERNLAEGDTITVYFERGKIDRARVEGSARGEYRMAVDPADTAAAERERIQYRARRIVFLVSRDRIVLDGAAHLTYGDLELEAGNVEYDVEKQVLLAERDPQLVDRGETVTGDLMTYDLETRVGNIYRAETTYERGLYHGRRIRKVSDQELQVLGGSYTTCDREEPHYHFAARYMKIYLKDKLVAKPVVFFVKNVPLLALPFWIFPIKPGRHSGFLFPQIEIGFTSAAGQFIRNAGYYWAPNDYMDLTVSGDYYQANPSWVLRAEGYYKLLYVLDGNFRTTYARNESIDDRSENWDLDAHHSHELSPRTRLTARASFVSSKDYNSSNQFGRSLYQRLNRFLVSNLSVSHAADWAAFTAAMDRRQDLDADDVLADPDGDGPLNGPPPGTVASLPNLTETFPVVSVGFPTRTIGSVGFLKGTALEKPLSTLYFDLDTRFVSIRERRGVVTGYREFLNPDSVLDSSSVIGQRVSTRRGLAASTSLSDSRRLLGWLNVQPSFNLNTVVFDFDELGNRVVPAATWTSALTTSATFYGTFLPRLGRLDGLRHIVTPSAAFSYSPEFPGLIYVDDQGRRQNRFRSFAGIGVSGFRTFLMSFALNQRLQVKLRRGEQIQRIDNLLSWSTTGFYDFLYRERGARRPLSNLNSLVTLQPPGFMSGNLQWVTDVYSARPLRSLTYNVGLGLSSGETQSGDAPDLPVEAGPTYRDIDDDLTMRERWAVDLAYSYSGGYPTARRWESNQTANVVLRVALTPSWGLDYEASYDVTNRALGIQQFRLTRDLHCWAASFTRTFAPGGEAEYYFRLGVKEQREIYIERGTRGGTLGGI